ncbi:hypothetical protein BDN71DRAFT_1513213 [Pleurotus eryngii]|uniref:Uncharacterized protein n=1 Tax=Pleurotus eryngii TaxID=5323 RepID=A0A9P6D938_PLEER|nr:hypothetical protein BDN71DRAFT_1513213 [Pleurotus eryngii]
MATFTTYAEAAQQSSQSQAAVVGNNTITLTSTYTNGPEPPVASSQSKDGDEDGGKKKKARRRKPCQHCIKREIGHLCHDEQRQKSTNKHLPPPQPKADTTQAYRGFEVGANMYSTPVHTTNPSWLLTGPFMYQPETLGNECWPSDFLKTLDKRSFFTPPPTVTSSLMAPNTFPPLLPDMFINGSIPSGTPASMSQVSTTATSQAVAHSAGVNSNNQKPSDNALPILLAAMKTEKFLLTAADQD